MQSKVSTKIVLGASLQTITFYSTFESPEAEGSAWCFTVGDRTAVLSPTVRHQDLTQIMIVMMLPGGPEESPLGRFLQTRQEAPSVACPPNDSNCPRQLGVTRVSYQAGSDNVTSETVLWIMLSRAPSPSEKNILEILVNVERETKADGGGGGLGGGLDDVIPKAVLEHAFENLGRVSIDLGYARVLDLSVSEEKTLLNNVAGKLITGELGNSSENMVLDQFGILLFVPHLQHILDDVVAEGVKSQIDKEVLDLSEDGDPLFHGAGVKDPLQNAFGGTS
eukprot:gene19412-biopygen6058